MNLRLDRVSKIGGCKCQADSVFSTRDVHWASSVFRPPARTLKMTVAPWPSTPGPRTSQAETGPPRTSADPPMSQTDSDPPNTSQTDIDLESVFTVSSPDEQKIEVSETVFPKKIDIDSQKLLSSVCTKTQRAQTGCNTRTSSNHSKRRTLFHYTDAQIRKPDQFLTRHVDHSYSRRLSSSCSASTDRAIQGFPNLLSRFKMNYFTPKETTSTLFVDGSSSIPKVTIYQPNFR